MSQISLSKIDIAREWVQSLKYDEFVSLNKAQVELINSIKDEFDFTLKVTAIGVLKIFNEDNLDNYDHYYIDVWDKIKNTHIKKLIKSPRRHWLDYLIWLEDKELGKRRAKRTNAIVKEAELYGLVLPLSKMIL